MGRKIEFKDWLVEKGYSNNVVGDVLSRFKRVNKILSYEGTNVDEYLFHLGQLESFKGLSIYVRSQLRKAVKLYAEYLSEE